MSSRPRRGSAGLRRNPSEAEEEDLDVAMGEELSDEDSEQQGPASRRGRGRPRKAPVDDDEGDYEPGMDDEEQQEKQEAPRRGRRGSAGGGDMPPPPKRGRRGSAAPTPGGDQAGPSRRPAAAAAAAAAAEAPRAGGTPRATAGELRKVDELIAEYRRAAEQLQEKAQERANARALEQASRAVARHMLFAHSEKPGVPVKRAEVAAVITARFPNQKSKAAVTNYVIAHAQYALAAGLGLEMKSLNKAAARERDVVLGLDDGAQQFVLRSVVPPQLRAAYVLDGSQAGERGLLMVVLALIHLAGGKLEEEELCSQLEELGVARGAPHPVFGRAADQLKAFCTRRYIQAQKQGGADGEVVTYRLAEQAVGQGAEIGEAAIRKFIDDQFAT